MSVSFTYVHSPSGNEAFLIDGEPCYEGRKLTSKDWVERVIAIGYNIKVKEITDEQMLNKEYYPERKEEDAEFN